MSLAEDSINPPTWRTWALRLFAALLAVAVVAALTMLARTLSKTPDAAKRQLARITILPDTPPPPPPPPRVEPKKPEPKDPPKQQPRQEAPKPQAAAPPVNAPIRMEGAAGSGESPFAAGPVTQDYKGGAPTIGPVASGPSGTGSDRAMERFYANSARQLLLGEIERQLRPEAGELTATFAIWVEADGRIRRHEVTAAGESANEADMKQALDGTARVLRLPPPGAVPQPMRFRLTVRSQG